MKRLRTEFTFDAAHRLQGYPGACAFIHGHTYRVVLELEFDDGAAANRAPFFMDFAGFKGLLKNEIERWDHSLIMYNRDPLYKVFGSIPQLQGGLIGMTEQPTAENMAYFLVHIAKRRYANYRSPSELEGWEILVDHRTSSNMACTLKVTVFETPKNAATVAAIYIGEGIE